MPSKYEYKACSKCNKLKPRTHENFRPRMDRAGASYGTCRQCEAKERADFRKRPKVAATTKKPDQPVVEEDPLATVWRRQEDQDGRRQSKRELAALLDENSRLKKLNSELVKLQVPHEPIIYSKSKADRCDAVACAIASDWHIEETVEKESVHGLNEYNLDIAKARSEQFFQNALRLTDIMARDSKITTIYLPILGDMYSGYIHEELMASTSLAPGDAARYARGLLASGIDFLLRESSYRIESDLIPGNHGRMTKQIWFSDPTGTSLESFMYHSLQGRYEDNPRVDLRVSGHAMRYRKFHEKFMIRLIHGYEVKYGGGVGGITIPINKAIAQWDTPIHADLTIMGHFHQRFDGGNFIVNGSLIGYNPFAQAIKAKFEEPSQAFFLIDARKGGQKSVVAPIWLDHESKREDIAASDFIVT